MALPLAIPKLQNGILLLGETDNIKPHVLCFSEHHLEEQEGPATSHMTRLHTGIRFLPSKSAEGRCVYFCS